MPRMTPREAVAHVLNEDHAEMGSREYQRGHTHGVVLYTDEQAYYFALAEGRSVPQRLRDDFEGCTLERVTGDTAAYCLTQGQVVYRFVNVEPAPTEAPRQRTKLEVVAEIDADIAMAQRMLSDCTNQLEKFVLQARVDELKARRATLTSSK
jgi:hypothetical protein